MDYDQVSPAAYDHDVHPGQQSMRRALLRSTAGRLLIDGYHGVALGSRLDDTLKSLAYHYQFGGSRGRDCDSAMGFSDAVKLECILDNIDAQYM